MKILYVDDSETCLVVCGSIFKKINIDCDMARSVNEAMTLIKKNYYNIILTDFQMPDKNGTEILNFIKNNKINSTVIVLTAFAMINDKQNFLNMGFDDYISKPFYIEELKTLINKYAKK